MKKGFLIISLIIAGLAVLPFKDYALDESDEEIKLYLGEVKILSVSNPTRIAIGNPGVLDVTNVTKNEITLSPKAVGATNLVLWDNFGEQSYQVRVFAENIAEVKRRIDNLLARLNLPGVYTQAEEEEGKVLLLGRVKTAQDREKISTALGALKEKTVDLIVVKEEEAVVDIDVQVLELSKDATDTLGFTNPLSSAESGVATGLTLTEVGSPGLTAAKWSTLFKVANLQHDAFTWTLYALVQEGKARILSRPRLACQSGKEAELVVGGEKPTFTTSTTTIGTSSTVEYKEYGIKLKIKPTVTEEKKIKLGLNVEVSEVGTAEYIGKTAERTAQAYPLTKRSASTELFLNNGQTMAIGGLIKQKKEEDISKTPLLGDIPIVGLFFRKKTTRIGGGTGERGDTELYITLTPMIIAAKEEIKQEVKPKVAASAAIEETMPESLRGYTRLIQKLILDNLNYPSSAKEAGFQGSLKLSLHLSYSGELLDVVVKSSSGYKLLDDNAVSVAKKVVSYPPFPSSIDQKELWIDIPIVYRLD